MERVTMAASAREGAGTGAPGRPGWGARPWPAFLFGLVLGVVGLGMAGLVIGGPIVLLRRNNLPLEKAYGDGAVGLAARLTASNQQNPLAQDARAVGTGRLAFGGSCSVCYGPNGNGSGVYGAATYPPATDLTSHDAKEKSDAELFWIIKHGLSFTGMPGFGQQYSDQDVWSLVSYLRTLQSAPPSSQTVATGGNEGVSQANSAGNAGQRGAAVYVAQGCQSCHGTPGATSGELALRGGGQESAQAVRQGRRGMPAYGSAQLSAAQLADLEAYLTGNGGSAGQTGE